MRIALPCAGAAVLAFGLAALPAAPAPAAQADEAAALGRLLTHEIELTRDGEAVVRLLQEVEIAGCSAVVTTTHIAPDTGQRRMTERSRFEIGRMDRIRRDGEEAEGAAGGGELPESLDLTARAYFVGAGDEGLSRWLDALAETRDAADRAAEMRALQFRVEEGEFGAFARANGYEMRSFLEGDPEPYYAMPLPVVSLTLPEDAPDEAAAAWWRYARTHCDG